MEESGDLKKDSEQEVATSTPDTSPKTKPKLRGKKRKRIERDSGSESDDGLPENAIEVEKNVIASAVKNNLDDVSVKKILKKVVTNDHVLALVKLREEEECSTQDSKLIPKLTRSKVKELTKVSPKSAPWDLQNLELTPIKHIPVKTRPEVKALIAQELPEDEDDEEYEPTHDDVPSDDDQCLESCSDLDSQPRTPATPRSQQRLSPRIVKDGPFKVPQEILTPTRRKLELEEEATIALRTRSKLCLSETPIEHIESSFVPPDELPVPRVDDHLWNEFLSECLNPASVSKHEDDDETDPEYSVAADPDAPDDDDEEALERSIIKISKKELNDLVTELFNIMPEESVDDELANMGSVVLENGNNQTPPRWEGKIEPTSDDEGSVKMVDRIVFERRTSITKFSVGKMEPDDVDEYDVPILDEQREREITGDRLQSGVSSNVVDIRMEERAGREADASPAADPPAPVRQLQAEPTTHQVQLLLDNQIVMLPEQIQILQQQLRQHIQLATSNFLQLFIHPIHWALGPPYKEYLESFVKIAESNPNSLVNVCNLKPALELCETWQKTVSEDTVENKEMVQFIQAQSDRCQRRIANNSFYAGEFHEMFTRTVANSPVFLYPFLLPAMPYRPVTSRRFSYTRAEDSLIALGMDQFWEYVDSNPDIFKKPTRPNGRHRWGLAHTVELVVKYMVPWLSHKVVMSHIMNVRRTKDKNNPINKFFERREVEPVKHRLLPFNPSLTLYEQPEHEMPRIWLRYLAKTSKRFKKYLNRKRTSRIDFIGETPSGVEINTCIDSPVPEKAPLPIDFTKEILATRLNVRPALKSLQTDKFDLQIKQPTTEVGTNFYKLVETSSGVNLVPLEVQTAPDVPVRISETNTVDCNVTPISSTVEATTDLDKETDHNIDVVMENFGDAEHCKCCVLLRKICKKQTVITDYFRSNKHTSDLCECRKIRCPRISNKLRLLVNRYKRRSECVYKDLMKKLETKNGLKKNGGESDRNFDRECDKSDAEDLAIVSEYHMKLTVRSVLAQNVYIKKSLYRIFSKFDPDHDDAIALARQLETLFQVEMVDLYKEFMGFLTAEQAEKMGNFRDYFTMNCVEGLVKKVEEQVADKEVRHSILSQLSSLFGGSWRACDMCAGLLRRMRGLPSLARDTFRLFPHCAPRTQPKKTKVRRDQEAIAPATQLEPIPADDATRDLTPVDMDVTLTAPNYEADHSSRQPKKTKVRRDQEAIAPATQLEPIPADDATRDLTPVDMDVTLTAPNYEADHSSSGDEESETVPVLLVPMQAEQVAVSETRCEPSLDRVDDNSPALCKNEPNDDSSDMSMMIMSEDEPIKTEPSEWKREEDKLILEYVLKVNLVPDEHKDKSVMEILEEKQVLRDLSQNLSNKSKDALKERILYLLNVLLAGKT